MENINTVYAASIEETLAAVLATLDQIREISTGNITATSTADRAVELAGMFGKAQGLAACAAIDLGVTLKHYEITAARTRRRRQEAA